MSKRAQTVTGIIAVVISLLLAAYALGAFRIPVLITETDSSGNVYTGSLNYGEFVGPVKITFVDGSVWEGELKKGLLDGLGTFTSAEGWIYTGNFDEGELLDGGKFKLPNGISAQNK